MRDLGVNWPVVQDNDYAQWRAYGNNYWPAHYFIDAKGRIRYWHFGEGGYAETETVIKKLLAEAGASVDETLVSAPPSSSPRSPRKHTSGTKGARVSPRR